jgi:hypothetical protein
MNPETVTKKVNPRSITTFFNSISSIPKFEDQLPLINMIGDGSIGEEPSALFAMFINNKLDKIISPEQILNNDDWSYVKGSLNSCIGVGDDFRADISSIISTRIINYALVTADKGSVSQKMIDRIISLVTDCESFTDDLRYYMVKEILNGNKPKFQKLMLNQKVVQMTIK